MTISNGAVGEELPVGCVLLVNLFGVITGDIVRSSAYTPEERKKMLGVLKAAIASTEERFIDATATSFEISRGDMFQGVFKKPEAAAEAAIFFRSRSLGGDDELKVDARFAIGIGTIYGMPKVSGEGDGDAYRRSGPVLDNLREANFAFSSPWAELDGQVGVVLGLIDALMVRWSQEQAVAVFFGLRGDSSGMIGKRLGVSRQAVDQRLRLAGYGPVVRGLGEIGQWINARLG